MYSIIKHKSIKEHHQLKRIIQRIFAFDFCPIHYIDFSIYSNASSYHLLHNLRYIFFRSIQGSCTGMISSFTSTIYFEWVSAPYIVRIIYPSICLMFTFQITYNFEHNCQVCQQLELEYKYKNSLTQNNSMALVVRLDIMMIFSYLIPSWDGVFICSVLQCLTSTQNNQVSQS